MAAASVVRAKHNRALGNFDARKNRSSDLPGVDIAGMGCNTTDGANAFLLRRKIRLNVGAQHRGISRVEAACNRRLPQHSFLLRHAGKTSRAHGTERRFARETALPLEL